MRRNDVVGEIWLGGCGRTSREQHFIANGTFLSYLLEFRLAFVIFDCEQDRKLNLITSIDIQLYEIRMNSEMRTLPREFFGRCCARSAPRIVKPPLLIWRMAARRFSFLIDTLLTHT